MYLLLVFSTILIMLHNLRLLDLQRGDGVSFFLARNSAHASTVVFVLYAATQRCVEGDDAPEE